MGGRNSRPVPRDLLSELMADKVRQSKEATEAGSETAENESPAYRYCGFEDKLAVCLKTKESKKPQGRRKSTNSRSSFTGEMVGREASELFKEHDIKTIKELWTSAAVVHKDDDFLGVRKKEGDGYGDYVWETYGKCNEDIVKIAKGIQKLGFERGTTFGIYSSNRPEWTKTAIACYLIGMVVVPIYDTLGEDSVQYVLNHGDCVACFAEGDKVSNVLAVKDRLPGLKHVFCYDEYDASKGVVSFNDLIADGGAVDKLEDVTVEADDLAIIMYTSGTTGPPKGVMLSHKNILASVAGASSSVEIDSNDSYLSYLPLAHIFESIAQFLSIAAGAKIGFYHGNVKELTADAAALKPTLFLGVPRVYQRIHQVVHTTLEQKSPIQKIVIRRAVRTQTANVIAGRPRSAFWDKKVFRLVQQALGGRVRIFVSGAAPLAPFLAEFLNVFFGAPLCEGYGMTETAAIIAVSAPEDPTLGHVGPPLAHCEVKFQSVPEMNYLHTDECPRGEIMVRGANIFKGYFKMPDKTKETIDEDGWMHTGDIGRYNPNGTITIIDRKKNIFKLAQGEYVAIEKVEGVYINAYNIGQFWGYGNSFKNNLVAIVVPDAERLRALAVKNKWNPKEGILTVPIKDIVAAHYDELKALFKEQMVEVETEAKLKGYEKVRDIYIEGETNQLGQGFSVDNDCLTPTFKLKRPQLQKRYQSKIDEMYEKLEKK